jgi:hypothetical protein
MTLDSCPSLQSKCSESNHHDGLWLVSENSDPFTHSYEYRTECMHTFGFLPSFLPCWRSKKKSQQPPLPFRGSYFCSLTISWMLNTSTDQDKSQMTFLRRKKMKMMMGEGRCTRDFPSSSSELYLIPCPL